MTDTLSAVGGASSRAHELAALFNAASIDEPVPGAPPDPVLDWIDTIAKHKAPPHLRFGSLRIRTYADGTWEPDDEGPRAVVLNVPTPDGEPCDLIAWLPKAPEKWWRRTGVAVLLGASKAREAKTLAVHSTPERWLFSCGRGVCVLDWSADLTRWLGDVPRLTTDSESLAARLRAALKRPLRKTNPTRGHHAN